MKRHKHFIVISVALGLLLTGLLLWGLSPHVAETQAAAPAVPQQVAFWEEDFSVSPQPGTYYILATPVSGLVDSGSFLLTQDATSQAGRIFYLTPNLMDEFSASFSLYLGSKDGDGADGAAFIFCPSYDYAQDTGGTLDASCPGGYIVAFDTYDIYNDTVYIAFNDHTNRLHTVGVGNLENDSWYTAVVIFDQGSITVTLDGSNIITGFAIPDYEPFTGYFGFSAATGDFYNIQRVDDINITVPSGQLEGHVYDAETLEPIAGASVIGERQDGAIGSAVSDPSGYYSMTVATGTYTVTAETDSLIDFASGVEVLVDEVTPQDFYLIDKVTFEPTPLHVTLDWQTTDSLNATLENRQPWTYDFEFYEFPGGFQPAVQGEEICSTLAAWPGPDGYGYTVGSVNFEWIEISSSGTAIPDLSDDDFEGPLPIGFNFNFYGNIWTDFYASSNGFISFDAGSGSVSNQCPLPNSILPNNIISIMWDDLYPNYDTGGLYYQTFDSCPVDSGKCLIVEYTNWAHCCNSLNSSGTWEAILFENGDIKLQYLDGGSEDGSSATSGIEGNDASANYGLTYACNSTGSLVDETAIYFTYQGVSWFGQEPLTGTLPASNAEPGEISASMSFSATYAAGVDQPGDYYTTLLVKGDPTLQVPVTMTVLPPVDMGSVTGSVTDNCTGEPIAQVQVAIAEGDPIDETWTDEDGDYSAWLFPGSYELTFSIPGYLPSTEKVDIFAGQETSLDVKLVPERACIQVYPQELEAWVLTDTLVFTHPTGLDISNNGGLELNFGLFELEGLPAMLSTDGSSSITSLDGSYVEFDPSVGGDPAYIPGAEQTFCFRTESYTNDYEWVVSLWERFPEDWSVHDVYVQGTPACDNTLIWGSFSWEYYDSHDYEIQINHLRQQAFTDHCTATYCFEVTSGAGGGAPVSWYWDGDDWGGTPHHPCSDDVYTPSSQPACDEAINPPAWVPEYEFDIPWLWEEPTGGTVAALSTFNVDILFSSVLPDPLPTGTYAATLWVTENDPVVPNPQIPVSMHVVEAFVDPLPSFKSNESLCLGETAFFTNTSVEGVPPTEYYLWDFGDGKTMTTETTETVNHDYTAAGNFTVSLTAHQKQTDVEVVFTDTIEIKPLPLADFSYTMDGLIVAFTNASANATSFLWDFGDGSSSDLENPTHTYDSAGVYTVSLTAYGECGMDQIEKTIAVGHIFLPLVYR